MGSRQLRISPKIQARIDTAQIQECCRKHYEIFVSAALAILFVIYLSYNKGQDLALLLWSSFTSVILVIRFVFVLWFNRLSEKQINLAHIHQFSLIMLCWGFAWSWGTVVFFPLLNTTQQAAWFAMFMVMVAASATSHSVYLRAFYAFALPYFVGMVWMVATEYPSSFHVNTIIVTLVMITQVGAAKKGNSMMLTSLRLRFENVDLIEELKTQKEHAERANLAKSQFLAAASHDLRQPLNALSLFGTALQNSLDDKQKSTELVGQINASIDALQELFNALLDISRLDAGTLVCEKVPFDSRDLFEKLDNDFRPLALAKGLSFELQTGQYNFDTDPTLLQLILRNLLSNALRYTQKGGVSVRVIEEPTSFRIEVSDTGIGIPMEQQKKVFEEFVQLHNPERDRAKGLGLGLSIVRRVSQLLGCDIHLDSTVGKGSTFAIRVDKGAVDAVENEVSKLEPSTLSSSGNVLVIDDEVTILSAMQALLEGWGYKVYVATNVNSAMTMLSTNQVIPDCVIVDFRLRENNTGLKAIEVIRAAYGRAIPALVVSGDIAPESLRLVKAAGLEMLHKPIKPARLRSFLQKQIG